MRGERESVRHCEGEESNRATSLASREACLVISMDRLELL